MRGSGQQEAQRGQAPEQPENASPGLAEVQPSAQNRGLVGQTLNRRQLQVRRRPHQVNQSVQRQENPLLCCPHIISFDITCQYDIY